MRNVQPHIFIPLGGLSDQILTDGKSLGDDTINFYPDDEGYLVNYPGRTDYFRRPPPDLPANVGTPPTTNTAFTRIHIYRDGIGQQHIVFVQGNKLCVVEGNSYIELYTFTGSTVDGVSWPTIFTHENKLIVLNEGDAPLIWDGINDVVPLGVPEIPPPPIGKVHEDPFLRTNNGAAWPFLPSPANPYGWWSIPGIWAPGAPPDNHLGNQEIDSTDIPGFYVEYLVYVDIYGNRSSPSAPSEVFFVQVDEESANVNPGYPDIKNWLTVQWINPKEVKHVYSVELYRTLNLHEDLGNTIDVAYRDWVQNNTVGSRYTARRSDGDISNDLLLDRDILPPKSTDLGASWGSRVLLRDPDDRNVTWISDEVYIGQYRINSRYASKDDVEAYVPIGDRCMIVTHTTCEVLYYDNSGLVRHLETYDNKGSFYGRTFATFGNIAFGFFHDGFFMFDGAQFTEVPTPYFLEPDFIDRYHNVQKAVIQGNWYRLTIRKDFTSEDNNVIIKCHLPTQRWFIVEESVNDLAVSNEEVLGVDDSIYFLYRGTTYPESVIHLDGVLPQGKSVNEDRVLTEVSLLVDPQSYANISIEASGSNRFNIIEGEGVSYPRISTLTDEPGDYYNKPNLTWEDNPPWVSPNDTWLVMTMDETITGYKHSVKLTFDAGLPQRIKGIQLAISAGSDDADKR